MHRPWGPGRSGTVHPEGPKIQIFEKEIIKQTG
jgi:hypothetical protein